VAFLDVFAEGPRCGSKNSRRRDSNAEEAMGANTGRRDGRLGSCATVRSARVLGSLARSVVQAERAEGAVKSVLPSRMAPSHAVSDVAARDGGSP
jgi:hypothetical protein